MIVHETEPEQALAVHPSTGRLIFAAVAAGIVVALSLLVTVRLYSEDVGAEEHVRLGRVVVPLILLVALRFFLPAVARLIAQRSPGLPTLRVTADGITRLAGPGRASFLGWDHVAGFTVHKLNGAPHHLEIRPRSRGAITVAPGATRHAGRRWLLENPMNIPFAQLPALSMDDLVSLMSGYRTGRR